MQFSSSHVCLGLCAVCEVGQRVMVVGGGLTSAHVVSIALQQGASHVTWVMRKHLQVELAAQKVHVQTGRLVLDAFQDLHTFLRS